MRIRHDGWDRVLLVHDRHRRIIIGGGGGGYGAVLATYGCVSAIVEATALRNYDNMLLALAMEMTVKYYATSGGGTP